MKQKHNYLTKKRYKVFLFFSISLLMSFSISAQSLYTKSGSDHTWDYIKSNNLIPIGSTSTAGIKGSTIDVNQNHSEISSSPYANRKIVDNMAIHTLGNATVPRKDFHKWTRWYQEDGNTQVFRLFKGEINVGNDVYYKPRIEAELKAHSKGVKINNGADWVEWSGTYTFVEPVEANIFQIWSNNDYVLMLTMKNNGTVQLNPRDQSGFKTILENGKGKSVHIRVRDYGNKYEVYVNGEKFYGRNYEAKYGSNRAAHFRWGIYASRKSGDHDGVPQDGMMFVTGAQRRYSNDTNISEGPAGYTYSCNQGQTVNVNGTMNVAYGANGQFVYKYNQSNDATCDDATFGDPIPGVAKKCYVKSVGGASSDEITSVDAPSSVAQASSINVKVDYSATTNREVHVDLQKNSSPWTTYASAKKNVSAGSGSLTFNLNVSSSAPAADAKAQYQVYITPNGGEWSEKLDNVAKTNIDITASSSSSDKLEGTYNFKSISTNMYMGTDPDGVVNLGTSINNEDYKWKLVSSSSNHYNIDNMQSGRGVLDSDGSGKVKWNTSEPLKTNDDTQWQAEHISGNIYRFNNKYSGRDYLYAKSDGTVGYKSSADNSTQWELISSTKSASALDGTVGYKSSADNSTQGDLKSSTKSASALDNGISENVSVYPNPTNGSFTINLTDMDKASVQIYDMNGRLQFEQKMTQSSLKIEQSDRFKPGMYLIRVIDENQNVYKQKLIVK